MTMDRRILQTFPLNGTLNYQSRRLRYGFQGGTVSHSLWSPMWLLFPWNFIRWNLNTFMYQFYIFRESVHNPLFSTPQNRLFHGPLWVFICCKKRRTRREGPQHARCEPAVEGRGPVCPPHVCGHGYHAVTPADLKFRKRPNSSMVSTVGWSNPWVNRRQHQHHNNV